MYLFTGSARLLFRRRLEREIFIFILASCTSGIRPSLGERRLKAGDRTPTGEIQSQFLRRRL